MVVTDEYENNDAQSQNNDWRQQKLDQQVWKNTYWLKLFALFGVLAVSNDTTCLSYLQSTFINAINVFITMHLIETVDGAEAKS